MGKIIIFGCGPTGIRAYKEYSEYHSVVGFMDNDPEKVGKRIEGVLVYEPRKEILENLEYDYILIASVYGLWQIEKQLREMGIATENIRDYVHQTKYDVLSYFLKSLSEIFRKENINGDCAEVGVFRGESAQKINRYFNDRITHLYDTFKGFAEEDLRIERRMGRTDAKQGQFADTSEALVMEKMEYPQMIILHKGFFPETARKLERKFCFVRIDMDLYAPTKAALELFRPLMVKGGVILVHDYFGEAYPGIFKAVQEFMGEYPMLGKIPIGDKLTIAITGF